jgi:type I restriction enzyme S subunit
MRLPDGWTSFRLGDYVGTASGGTPSRKRLDYFNGSIPWVKSGELPDGMIQECGEFLSPEGLKNSSAKVFAKGSLLIALYGATVGKLGFLTFDASTNQAVCAILPPEGIASRYLFYFLLHRRLELVRAGQGGAQANISQEIVREIEVPLPPIDEQQRIVAKIDELFSELDAGVASLKRARALLKKYRQAVLKAAVAGELTRDWRERHRGQIEESGADLLQRILKVRRESREALPANGSLPKNGQKYKESQPPNTTGLPTLPEGWAWSRVHDIGDVQLGRQRAPQHHFGSYMRPYLRVMNVFEDKIDVSDVMEMNFSPEEYHRFVLKPGDILLNEGQSLDLVGRPAMYRGELEGACFTNTLVRFTADQLIDPRYPLIVFRHYLWSGRFQKIARITTNIAHLGAGRFANLEFPLPSLEEQVAIIEQFEELFSDADAVEQQLNQIDTYLVALRKSILKAAFAGKLVPQDPDDEPASVLLERLRAERAARPNPARGRRPQTQPAADRQLELLA